MKWIEVREASRRRAAYEQIGLAAILETRDLAAATQICELHLQALRNELEPEKARLQSTREDNAVKQRALTHALYERSFPVSDLEMIATRASLIFLSCAFVPTACVATAGNVVTLMMIGWELPWALASGVGISSVAIILGHVGLGPLLKIKSLRVALSVVAMALFFAGLYQFAQVRGDLTGRGTTRDQAPPYVDGAVVQNSSPSDQPDEKSLEQEVKASLGDALANFTISGDVLLSIMFATILAIRTDPDFSAWMTLKKLAKEDRKLERKLKEIEARINLAWCAMAIGLQRGMGILNQPPRPPYFKIAAALVLSLILGNNVAAQPEPKCLQALLLDGSGSIGKQGQFRSYLFGIKAQLLNTPPECRLWAFMISTESFGSVPDIVKGWTPAARGIFTDELSKARAQLAAAFESKSQEFSPSSAGTDVIGGVFRARATLESVPSSRISKSILLWSDMVNETTDFNMPAMIPVGIDKMMELVKSKGLLADLKGYRVYVYGASTSGLTPHAWSTVREFWQKYFQEAGATLLVYSTEATPLR